MKIISVIAVLSFAVLIIIKPELCASRRGAGTSAFWQGAYPLAFSHDRMHNVYNGAAARFRVLKGFLMLRKSCFIYHPMNL